MKTKNILKNKKLISVGVVILGLLALFLILKEPKIKVDFIDFINKVESNKIEQVELTENSFITFKEKDNSNVFKTENPNSQDFKSYLLLKDISVKENTSFSVFQSIFSILILFSVLVIIYKSNNKARKNNKVFNPIMESEIYFKDIAGNEEAKENAKDIVDFLKNSDKYVNLGARIPRGIIFYGSPGTGKTLMAKAIASEAEVPFYSVCGSDFVERYVGVGAERIRSLFKEARSHKKAVIFIDEIDALGKKRSSVGSGSTEERDQTLNALLNEMSGFSKEDGIIVIGTTNRIDVLDEALIRAGRFDRHIEITLPDKSGRKKIIELHLSNKPFNKNIDLEEIAKKTVYFSGAMLESLINEASIFAVKSNEKEITKEHLDKAYLKIIAGDEKKDTSSILEMDRKITAYHEAGHALVTKILDKDITISKISIIPSNKGAGGFCVNILKDKMFYTKKDLENQIMISYAGRISEKIIFGEENITTGAQNDIEKATKIILDYVNKYSMDNNTAPLNQELINKNTNLSEKYNIIANKLYEKTEKIIKENLNLLESLAKELLLKESLDESEINKIFNFIVV